MACGLPVIACAAHGPRGNRPRRAERLAAPPDDEPALAAALLAAASNPHERQRRGTKRPPTLAAATTGRRSLGHIAGLYEQIIAPVRAAERKRLASVLQAAGDPAARPEDAVYFEDDRS